MIPTQEEIDKYRPPATSADDGCNRHLAPGGPGVYCKHWAACGYCARGFFYWRLGDSTDTYMPMCPRPWAHWAWYLALAVSDHNTDGVPMPAPTGPACGVEQLRPVTDLDGATYAKGWAVSPALHSLAYRGGPTFHKHRAACGTCCHDFFYWTLRDEDATYLPVCPRAWWHWTWHLAPAIRFTALFIKQGGMGGVL